MTETLAGIIYAEGAEEVEAPVNINDKNLGHYGRYSDFPNNSVYAEGFHYDKDLDSYIWNGFLHYVSKRIKELESCDVSKQADLIAKTRYVAQQEINDIDFISNDTYVKSAQIQSILEARYDYFKYSEIEINDDEKTNVLDIPNCQKAIAFYNGTDFPLNIIDYEGQAEVVAKVDHINVLKISKPLPMPQENVVFTIDSLSDSKCHFWGIKHTIYVPDGQQKYIIKAQVKFNKILNYRSIEIPSNTSFDTDQFEIILKNNEVLFFKGLHFEPIRQHLSATDEDVLSFLQTAI